MLYLPVHAAILIRDAIRGTNRGKTVMDIKRADGKILRVSPAADHSVDLSVKRLKLIEHAGTVAPAGDVSLTVGLRIR